MQNSKKGCTPFQKGITLSKNQCPKTLEKEAHMRRVSYTSAMGSLLYAMLCTKPNIYYAIGIVSHYQSNLGPEHWNTIKHILKYLNRTKNYMLVYSREDLTPIGYTNSDFNLIRTQKSQPLV